MLVGILAGHVAICCLQLQMVCFTLDPSLKMEDSTPLKARSCGSLWIFHFFTLLVMSKLDEVDVPQWRFVLAPRMAAHGGREGHHWGLSEIPFSRLLGGPLCALSTPILATQVLFFNVLQDIIVGILISEVRKT